MPKKMRDYKVVAELGVEERKELEAKFQVRLQKRLKRAK